MLVVRVRSRVLVRLRLRVDRVTVRVMEDEGVGEFLGVVAVAVDDWGCVVADVGCGVDGWVLEC